jgi:hypothetical protein
LFIIDPILFKIFFDFNKKYHNFKLLDVYEFESLMPISFIDFKNKSIKTLNSNINYLVDNWIKECVDLILENRASIENLVIYNNQVIIFLIKKIIYKI